MKLKDPLYRFIITAIGIYILWFLMYDLYLKPQGSVDAWLSYLDTEVSTSLLKMIGYDCEHLVLEKTNHILYNDRRLLQVARSCNGLILYPLFAGFIIATPGSLKKKLSFIPIGFIGIFIINIIRICALTITKIHAPQYLHFNHHYTFTVLVYSFIFFLWMIWIKQSKKGNVKSKHNA